jgi:hypothetical protein
MRATTLNSYLYTQYQDDDDLQATRVVYNQATQTYVDWFNTVGLPFYPGLNGPLLDWVVRGLYGMTRPSFLSPATPLGPFNTVPLNTSPMTFNAFVPSTSYATSDDALKRMLTWNFYKGDGKRFCMRWLKRRVMRFLAGVNGLDPQPGTAGFVVGTENTSAIGAHVASGGVLTVNVSQSALSALLAVTPGVLPLFQLAFQSGVLEIPAQFPTYIVNINA